ncbi:MAG TPA: histidine kinase dimerization/phospho-acceptor domain-containing protein, partial [Verrucomicrobiae bacterium]|nr:histidine kinase dimerization/phospho-acceptor domain-containing protein [Verrucomicrobiae bacterium]
MKIFNSIRWRLQIWYGLILVVVLAGFGVTAYQLERGRQFRRVDEGLQRRFNFVADVTRPHPHPPDQNRPPFDRPGMEEFPEGPPDQNHRPAQGFHLPPQAANLFDTNDPNNFYFIATGRDGHELGRSANAPTADTVANSYSKLKGPADIKPPVSFMFGDQRWRVQSLPSGDVVLVGCSVKSELKELQIVALTLGGVGAGILLVGLLGGWWIANRAIRPIQDISTAAVKISAGDLSQRINTAETESELGKLAAVLNSTFARLETSFAQQQQFTSDAAHELRTPVSVILTQTQTALNRERSSAEYRETLEACQRSAQRMRRLIVSLLELARLDAGQEQMKRMKFDLAATVRDNVELTQPLADERGIKILTELAPVECLG